MGARALASLVFSLPLSLCPPHTHLDPFLFVIMPEAIYHHSPPPVEWCLAA